MGDVSKRSLFYLECVISQIAPLIDSSKYTLIVNTLDAMVTVRWKITAQTPELKQKFGKAKKLVNANNRKKLVASCSSTLTLHSMDVIISRIKNWCSWHSAWVYDLRPVVNLRGFFIYRLQDPLK